MGGTAAIILVLTAGIVCAADQGSVRQSTGSYAANQKIFEESTGPFLDALAEKNPEMISSKEAPGFARRVEEEYRAISAEILSARALEAVGKDKEMYVRWGESIKTQKEDDFAAHPYSMVACVRLALKLSSLPSSAQNRVSLVQLNAEILKHTMRIAEFYELAAYNMAEKLTPSNGK